MDGWETRRHNHLPFDYTVIRLGVSSGRISGVEIDTSFFQGNEAPAISVEACFCSSDAEVISWGNSRGKWRTVLGMKPCGPNQRHAWELKENSEPCTHVRLNMYPDGGIARFRLYGIAIPILPDVNTEFDLAAATNGGMAVSWSDHAFGTLASNLLLPGRGPDMADGWETSRSRTKDHVDWVIVRLCVPGMISKLLVDTAHFRGNFPERVLVSGLNFRGTGTPSVQDKRWRDLMAVSNCEADKEHVFKSLLPHVIFTHMMLKIFPDGGVKRLRVFGLRAPTYSTKL